MVYSGRNVSVTLVIHDRKVDAMTLSPVGMVRRWMYRLMREIRREASLITRASTHTYTPGPDLADSYKSEFLYATTRLAAYALKNSRPYAAPVFVGHPRINARPGSAFPIPKKSLGYRVGVKSIPKNRLDAITFAKFLPLKVGRNFPMMAVSTVFTRRGML